MPELREIRQVVDLSLRVGEVLIANGAGAAEVTATMEELSQHYGLQRVDTDVTFTSLRVSYQGTDGGETVIVVRRVKHRALDYGDLTDAHRLVEDVLSDRIELNDARARSAAILASPPQTAAWIVTLAWGVMCAGVAVMFGGGPAVAAVAAVTGVVNELVRTRKSLSVLPSFYLKVVGGLIATTSAIIALELGLTDQPSVAISANIIMLLSGVGFVGAFHDALSGFLVTSAARLIEAFLATAGLIAGVSGGLGLAGVLGSDIARLLPARSVDLELLPTVLIGAGVAASAFAVASYSPGRVVAPIFVVCAIGMAITQGMGAVGFGPAWSVGVAALMISLISRTMSRWTHVPAWVIVLSSTVPLLPGLSIYRGLALLGQEDAAPIQGMLALIGAASIAVALSAGVILGEYLSTPLRPGVQRVERRVMWMVSTGAEGARELNDRRARFRRWRRRPPTPTE